MPVLYTHFQRVSKQYCKIKEKCLTSYKRFLGRYENYIETTRSEKNGKALYLECCKVEKSNRFRDLLI